MAGTGAGSRRPEQRDIVDPALLPAPANCPGYLLSALATVRQLFVPKFSRFVTTQTNLLQDSETIHAWQPHPNTPQIQDLAAIKPPHLGRMNYE